MRCHCEKIGIAWIFALFVCLLTGCSVDQDTRMTIIDSLKEEEILDANATFVESFSKKYISYLISISVYDVYEDDQGNLTVLQISSCEGSFACDADYEISIYDVTKVYEDIRYIDEDELGTQSLYYIFDDCYTLEPKYQLTLRATYQARQESSWWGKTYYTLEKVE